MIHVGNDIIDLTATASVGKSRDIRFIKRVFTTYEQSCIDRTDTPDTMLWNLWAAKEAAYKAVKKAHPEANSIPRSYEVHLEGTDRPSKTGGHVCSPYGKIKIRTDLACYHIHCVSMSGEGAHWDSVISRVEEISTEERSRRGESGAIRNLLRKDLSHYLSISPDDMEILRRRGPRGLGPPQVYIGGKQAAVDISMSHDGSFMAYAFVTG